MEIKKINWLINGKFKNGCIKTSHSRIVEFRYNCHFSKKVIISITNITPVIEKLPLFRVEMITIERVGVLSKLCHSTVDTKRGYKHSNCVLFYFCANRITTCQENIHFSMFSSLIVFKTISKHKTRPNHHINQLRQNLI